MCQYYRNCDGAGLYVCPGYVLGGVTYATAGCVCRANGAHVFRYYSSTVSTASYGAFVC